MSENIIIREAIDEDSDFIMNLIFDIWVNEHRFNVNKKDFPDLCEVEKYYGKAGGVFLVAVMNNVIVGTIACDKLNHESFVLKRMFVSKPYRGLGIAQLLMNKLFEKIAFLEYNEKISFFLSTKEDEAIAAKAFYLKNGFRVISKSNLPKNFPFFYKDDLFMMKKLSC